MSPLKRRFTFSSHHGVTSQKIQSSYHCSESLRFYTGSSLRVKSQPQCYTVYRGRAIAQAVSRWLPTAAARVHCRVWSSGICGGQGGAEEGFLHHHNQGQATLGQSVADVPSGPSWTPSLTK
jgi:hypothetical protein